MRDPESLRPWSNALRLQHPNILDVSDGDPLQCEFDLYNMFAVVSREDETGVFVKYGAIGYWLCYAVDMEAWMKLHSQQGDSVADSAIAGAMFGWDVPAAQLATRWQEE